MSDFDLKPLSYTSDKTTEIDITPNPALITCVVIISLALLYMIYVVFLKSSLSGTWISSDITGENPRVYEIIHSKMLDDVYLIGPSGRGVHGQKFGAAVFFNNGYSGLWDYNNILEIYDNGALKIYLERILN